MTDHEKARILERLLKDAVGPNHRETVIGIEVRAIHHPGCGGQKPAVGRIDGTEARSILKEPEADPRFVESFTILAEAFDKAERGSAPQTPRDRE